MKSYIEVDHVSKKFGKDTALYDVCLDMEQGKSANIPPIRQMRINSKKASKISSPFISPTISNGKKNRKQIWLFLLAFTALALILHGFLLDLRLKEIV